MDQGSLVNEQIAAQIAAAGTFLSELEKSVHVQVAFWGKDSEDGRWNLYVAPDQVDETEFYDIYGDVIRISGEMNDPYFDPFQVKLVKWNDPLAQAATDIHRRYPNRAVVRSNTHTFASFRLGEVYIYPSPAAVGGA